MGARIDEREDKLPRWAQSQLQKLRADIEDYKGQLASAAGESTQSSEVRIRDYQSEREGRPRFLPTGTRVTFTVAGNEIDFGVEAGDNTYVRVSVSGPGSPYLAVTGGSSNAMHISGSQNRGATTPERT